MTAPSVITADTKIESPDASDTQSESPDIDYEAEKRLLRKLDWHILPVVAPLYVCSFLDRINIGKQQRRIRVPCSFPHLLISRRRKEMRGYTGWRRT